MDVTWTPKFAAAGWLLPLDDVFRPEELSALLPRAVDAGRYRGHLYRIPVRTDVGLLYYRRDLLEEAGIASARDVRGPRRRGAAPSGSSRPLGLRLAGEPVRGPHVRVPRDPPWRGRLLGGSGVARSGPGPARGGDGAGISETIAPRGRHQPSGRDEPEGGRQPPSLPGRARRLPAQLALRLAARTGARLAGGGEDRRVGGSARAGPGGSRHTRRLGVRHLALLPESRSRGAVHPRGRLARNAARPLPHLGLRARARSRPIATRSSSPRIRSCPRSSGSTKTP